MMKRRRWQALVQFGLAVVLSIAVYAAAWAAPLSVPAPEQAVTLKGQEKQAYMQQELQRLFDPQRKHHSFMVPDGWTWTKGQVGTVPVEQMTAEVKQTDRVLLQLHGGGYVLGLSNMNRLLGLRQGALIQAASVYYADYRLAPQHTYPAALEDAVRVYQGLLEQGVAAEHIVVAGDSAGGNLAIALAVYVRDHHLPQPGALILQSPWADFESASPSRTENAGKDLILGTGKPLSDEVVHPAYAGTMDLRDPRLSLVHADLSDLAPMLIQAGGHEVFLSECQALAAKAAADGTEVTLTVYPQMPHDFVLLLPEMKESAYALLEIRDFVNRYVPGK
ncbi:alpha/beta hydrolase [uncultured Megasphaera sp.]|uniref:alpha/beta hydrolase n=1 Tax=uncultured Megasphaera sp. TaxID=165188 RepID=UPI002657AD5F|nr:alpha/beta hydrolase [uncultured Megasphaera sp.]